MDEQMPHDPRTQMHRIIRRGLWVIVALSVLGLVYLYIHGSSVYENIG